MDINLINFLEELETKGLFKSKVGEIDEKFKKFVDSLKISIEEKQILECSTCTLAFWSVLLKWLVMMP